MKYRRKFEGDGHKAAEALYGPRKDKSGQQRMNFDKQPPDPQDNKEKK